jgi:hypothetical protein
MLLYVNRLHSCKNLTCHVLDLVPFAAAAHKQHRVIYVLVIDNGTEQAPAQPHHQEVTMLHSCDPRLDVSTASIPSTWKCAAHSPAQFSTAHGSAQRMQCRMGLGHQHQGGPLSAHDDYN